MSWANVVRKKYKPPVRISKDLIGEDTEFITPDDEEIPNLSEQLNDDQNK